MESHLTIAAHLTCDNVSLFCDIDQQSQPGESRACNRSVVSCYKEEERSGTEGEARAQAGESAVMH